MSKVTRFQASNGHIGQVKHNVSLTDDQLILLIKDCYQQLKDKQVILIK